VGALAPLASTVAARFAALVSAQPDVAAPRLRVQDVL